MRAILSWNPHGFENPRRFIALPDLLKKEDLNLVFLQKTKVKTFFLTTKKFYFGYRNCLRVDCEGKSGGLAVLWKEDVDLQILHYSHHHIHRVITMQPKGDRLCLKWSLIGVYGHLEVARRSKV